MKQLFAINLNNMGRIARLFTSRKTHISSAIGKIKKYRGSQNKKDSELIKTKLVEFLKKKENGGQVEITDRNDHNNMRNLVIEMNDKKALTVQETTEVRGMLSKAFKPNDLVIFDLYENPGALL